MFDWTERPGSLQPLDARRVIEHRYSLATARARGRRVLEVGSGASMGLRALAKVAELAVGCEYSIENLEHTPPAERGAVVCGDAHALPFRDASFDLVVAMAMVYYLRMDEFLAEVRRVLRPGGRLFFCMSNTDIPGFVAAPHTTRYYSIPEMRDVLSRAGLAAAFGGAFPTAIRSLWALRARAVVKGVAKTIVTGLPGGGELWSRWRVGRLGELAPLPHDVPIVDVDDTEPLPADAIDTTHRVIYVDAWPLDDCREAEAPGARRRSEAE